MKTKTQPLLLFCFFLILHQATFGQELNRVPLGSFTIVDHSVFEEDHRRSATACKRVDRDGVNESIMREFRYHFLTASNMDWYALDNRNRRYVVYFSYEGNEGKALYAKNTGLQYAIVYVPESFLTKNDRNALSFYSGYTISKVMETTAEGQTFLVVKLIKKDHVVLVKIKSGIMTELQDWTMSEETGEIGREYELLVKKH